MKVHCRTNLDLSGEKWPDDLPAVPNKGDRIQSRTIWRNNFQLELEVCAVTWKYDNINNLWYPEIELHTTSWQRMLRPVDNPNAAVGSIVAFYDWYAPLVGRTPSAFI